MGSPTLVTIGHSQFLILERSIRSIGPLAHRAVVVASPVVAEEPQRKHSVRRTDAALSIRNDVLVKRDSYGLKHGPELGRGFERPVAVLCDQVEPLEMDSARHPAGSRVAPAVGAVPLLV